MQRTLITNEALLRRPCSPCSTVAEGLRIGRELLDFVRKYNRERLTSQAAGLAAPQLGILKQVCVLTTNPNVPLVLVNPRIVAASKTRVRWTESCISMPRRKAETFRHLWVEVAADNLATAHKCGQEFDSDMFGVNKKTVLEAVCVQHEIAHLAGLLITDFQEDKDFFTILKEKGCKLSLTAS